MEAEAVEQIEKLVRETGVGNVLQTEVGDLQVVVQKAGASLEHLPDPKRPEPLELTGLQAASDYLGANVDGLKLDTIMAIVDTPTHVSIVGALEANVVRPVYARTSAPPVSSGQAFGRYMPVEEMIIALQSLFVPTEEQRDLIELLSNITAGETRTATDDGISQEVTTKATTRLATREKLPNPVRLEPYRTFFEIPQPSSAYVCRVQDNHDNIEVALFDAHGGLRRDQAMQTIREHLSINMPTKVSVL